MQKRVTGGRGLIAAAGALFVTLPGLACAAADGAVVLPVRQLVDGLVQIMKAGPGTPLRRRFDLLGSVIERVFDLAAILMESLGSSGAAGLPAEQQAMLATGVRRYTVASDVNSFDDYIGQHFNIGGEQVVQIHVIVFRRPTARR
jgi:phospholipid transport system substrate-binding protein